MNEKEIALLLESKAKRLEENNLQANVPVDLKNSIDKCDFKLLQKECDALGFHICYAYEAPFDTKFYRKQYQKDHNKYLVYTDKSINNINYYWFLSFNFFISLLIQLTISLLS